MISCSAILASFPARLYSRPLTTCPAAISMTQSAQGRIKSNSHRKKAKHLCKQTLFFTKMGEQVNSSAYLQWICRTMSVSMNIDSILFGKLRAWLSLCPPLGTSLYLPPPGRRIRLEIPFSPIRHRYIVAHSYPTFYIQSLIFLAPLPLVRLLSVSYLPNWHTWL